MSLELRVVSTEDDYLAWRQVRIGVVPAERCDTVEELRRDATPTRLLLLASRDGVIIGSGAADKSDLAGGGSVMPRVLPQFRRQGAGSALLRALSDHVARLDAGGLNLTRMQSRVDDPGSMEFALRFGFAETDRQVEQVRPVGDEPEPSGPPAGVEVVTTAQRPGLWAQSFDRFGQQALADFAVDNPMQVSAEQWNAYWAGDPMFLAVVTGPDGQAEVVGCAGLHLDTDQPSRAENALTAVRRDWRGRGLASYLKRLTLHWAASSGLTEVCTWTQRGNESMRRLNTHLGYHDGQVSINVSRPLPLPPPAAS